ncbi:TetR/AcrR family transcriptional regulator [Quadrisphaera setariae]|uniref:TetR/AcrR family transcriptional regulator n=1 Tax=Quadrisphaera setariae TaxID=2593304 RepID=A0A5C8ZJC1_9ACTN|nr:TetR/AcrR family transcriptional regulator [Quadrisphaera setariae]TXR57714.1 TetR/AcrR family transcriptional regulator [Quadrisphaera setariae]
MNATLTARERARRELTAEILSAARRQLAESGAAALSVRAVARELGMASSAVYRYVATRDELLTALIIEAYDSCADAVESACAPAPGRTPRDRFASGCRAVRGWALAHPHEYALVHGSPVPGYRGDERTTAAGSRAPLALLAVLADAAAGRASGAEAPGATSSHDGAGALRVRPVTPLLEEHAGRVVAAGGERLRGLAPEVVVAGARAWTALLGLVSSELFGQLANTFDPADAFSEAVVEAIADDLGL